MNIGYFPAAAENAYVLRTQSILGGIGTIVPLASVRALIRYAGLAIWKRERLDVIVLNWLENVAVSVDGAPSLRGLLKLLLVVCCARIASKRLVFVRHNWFVHHASGMGVPWSRWAIRIVEHFSRIVVVHSGHVPLAGKLRYVPHPLYQVGFEACGKTRTQFPSGGFYLVMGRLLPYKRILELLRAWPDGVNLWVVGPASDQDYLDALKLEVRSRPHIVLKPHFVSEGEAAELASSSLGVVICHSESSMIVSGSYFFAISYGRCLLGVRSPSLDWLRGRLGVPQMKVFETLESLCLELPLADNHVVDPLLRASAEREFSDEHCRSAWAIVLGVASSD